MNHDDKPSGGWIDTMAGLTTALVFATVLAVIWLTLWKLVLYPVWSWAT